MQLEEENTIQPITDKKIEDVYEFKKELGTGAFSVVHSAIHKQTKVERAVKTIDKSAIKEKKEMLQREVDILKRIQHPNIIAVVEIYETPKYLHLVMELSVWDVILLVHAHQGYRRRVVRFYCEQREVQRSRCRSVGGSAGRCCRILA